MSIVRELDVLVDPATIAARLRALLGDACDERISVGVRVGERVAQAGSQMCVVAGCTTKLFTAAMMCEAIAQGHFDLDGRLGGLAGNGPTGELLLDVTPRQLMEHAHGFDDSAIDPAQFRRDGFIDADDLCACLESFDTLAAPGEQYSYGNCGALLVAALLESVHGRRFPELLTEYMSSLGCSLESRITGVGEPACPATGGPAALPVAGFLRFLAHQTERCDGTLNLADSERLARELRALPGWHGSEQGIHLGWKCYGAGWYGHNSEFPGHGLMVRLHPEERIAIVVASGDHPPAAIAAAVFRKHLPSLTRLAMPKLRADAAVEPDEAARSQGTYANGVMSVRITPDDQSRLRLDIADTRTGATLLEPTRLHPAQDRIFFLQPPALKYFPFVQFIGERPHRRRYLWTGSQILPRVESRG